MFETKRSLADDIMKRGILNLISMYLLALFSFLLILNHSPYPITTNAASLIRTTLPSCWHDDRFLPVTFRECIDIINKDILRSNNPDEPLKFSHDSSLEPDVQLPKYWRRPGVNCGIGVDLTPGEEGYDRTTLRDIQQAARDVAVACVIQPPHAGGFAVLGWHGKLGVLITGKTIIPTVLRNGTSLER
ncbi:MAG: hypothetical protein Q9169_007598 [Polycauliona sp. 2 TL-2023]